MKKLQLLAVLMLLLVGLQAQSATKVEIVDVQETEIPILLDREDNELMRIRVDGTTSDTFQEITLQFGKDTQMKYVESVKLYYSGTEAYEFRDKVRYRPVNYVESNSFTNPRAANLSYSVLQSESKSPGKKVTLKSKQKLFPGVNYFWVSIKMKRNAPLATTKFTVKIDAVKISGSKVPVRMAQAEPVTHRVGLAVRTAGDDGVAAYRIPGLVTTKRCTLLGVYDIRHNSSVDLQEWVEIGLSRSTDGGQTWEPMRTPMSFDEEGGLPKAQNGCGDPAILVDTKKGTIWIVAAWTHGEGNRRAWNNSQQGMSEYETAQLMMVKSTDDGKTWSKPMNFTEGLKDPEWWFLLQGPGRGITMQDGTLVFASQYIGADRVPNAGIIYSKDHGKTWKISNYARTNTTESQVAEIEPGKLMLNMRDNRGGSRAVMTTTDMGKTWEEHESSRSALQEPVCMASLISVNAKENVLKKDILLFSNPNTTEGRHHITIKASLDGGKTWPDEYQLLLDAEWGWGYSCLTMIDKETIGILYEGSTAHMTFQAVKLKDLINIK